MKSETKLAGGLALTVTLFISQVVAFAQQPRTASPEQGVVVSQQRIVQGPGEPKGPLPADTFVFVASEMNFDGKLVKGAPYSAEAVTESIQTLADGNRIVNKSTAMVYRDSEGRTRREHTLTALGPFATSGDAPQTISINDPVAGVNYALDPRTKTAHKMAPMKLKFKMAESPGEFDKKIAGPDSPPAPGAAQADVRIERSQTPPPPGGMGHVDVLPGDVFMHQMPGPGTAAAAGGMVMEWHSADSKNAKSESLGKQVIEGVEAEGTRTTMTIPPGQIGNEREIQMVSERWYSPELQVVVMTKHSDPRMGETTYSLTNINRSEQPKSLFEVPADYTVKETSIGGPLINKMKMRKPSPEQ
jgi:hypothetical protein